ncbi:hypothetical protein [Haladaptatus salinisoli]|uniref:hypothetical protein n=1 Tax=Haladaptatus salinisoli TaxID=2884876 RepID=UPI001D0B7B22|nr:hypothetical protein [Haladaptatus salinisoli]
MDEPRSGLSTSPRDAVITVSAQAVTGAHRTMVDEFGMYRRAFAFPRAEADYIPERSLLRTDSSGFPSRTANASFDSSA